MTNIVEVEYELRSSDQSLSDMLLHRGSFVFDNLDPEQDPKILIQKLTGWGGHINILHVAQRIVHNAAEVLNIS